MNLPAYRDLPIDPSKPPGSSWGLWGDDDQRGTINLLGPNAVRRGIDAARKGLVFALNLPLEEPDPPFFGREPLAHTLIPNSAGFDDRIDSFYPQGSTQWDALSHCAHPEFGFYNGHTAEQLHGGPGTRLGIDNLARTGIVGRGVLLDLARHFAGKGDPVDGGAFREFTVADLEEVRRAEGIVYEQGDILVLRTGWLDWYRDAPLKTKQTMAADSFSQLHAPGISGGEDMAEYLWDSHLSAIVADSPSIEAWPHPFVVDGYLHFRLIPLLGFSMGEMWDLEALAADCAGDEVYEFLLTSAPLNLRGGVGSSANAIAIK